MCLSGKAKGKADVKAAKTLLAAVNGYNFLTITLTRFDPKTDGSYRASNQLVKEAIAKTFQEKLKNAIVDTATTQTIVDGITVDRFRVTVILKGLTVFNSILLSDLYKGYDFGVFLRVCGRQSKGTIGGNAAHVHFCKIDGLHTDLFGLRNSDSSRSHFSCHPPHK